MAQQHYFVAIRPRTGYSGSQQDILNLQSSLELTVNVIGGIGESISNDEFVGLMRRAVQDFWDLNHGTVEYVQVNLDNNFYLAYDDRGLLADPRVDNQFDFDQVPVLGALGASDHVLVNNGGINRKITGANLFAYINGLNVPRVLYQNHVATSKSDADTTETTLRTVTIPGGLLGTGGTLRITPRWTFPNSATNKVLRIRFGGTAFWTTTQTTNSTLMTQLLISNRDATNSQIGIAATTGFASATGAFTLGTVDTTVAQDLTFTGQWGTAGTGTNNTTLESVVVEFLPAVA